MTSTPTTDARIRNIKKHIDLLMSPDRPSLHSWQARIPIAVCLWNYQKTLVMLDAARADLDAANMKLESQPPSTSTETRAAENVDRTGEGYSPTPRGTAVADTADRQQVGPGRAALVRPNRGRVGWSSG